MTQGTIFTCAVAEDYVECPTHGLVITARCDVAHDKVRSFNYVPIVSLDDWLHRDGRIIMGHRLAADSLASLRAVLKENNFSASILETETPRSVLTALFGPAQTSGKVAKARERFTSLCDRYELAVRCVDSAPSDCVCIPVAEAAPKLRDALIGELVSHRLAGYYFLRRVDQSGDDNGFVALLRDVQSLPRHVARAIAEGLDACLFSDMCNREPTLRGRLRIASDDLAMPIGILPSPNIEHLLQSFSLLFTRIGVDDLDHSYVARLWSRQPSVKENT